MTDMVAYRPAPEEGQKLLEQLVVPESEEYFKNEDKHGCTCIFK